MNIDEVVEMLKADGLDKVGTLMMLDYYIEEPTEAPSGLEPTFIKDHYVELWKALDKIPEEEFEGYSGEHEGFGEINESKALKESSREELIAHIMQGIKDDAGPVLDKEWEDELYARLANKEIPALEEYAKEPLTLLGYDELEELDRREGKRGPFGR